MSTSSFNPELKSEMSPSTESTYLASHPSSLGDSAKVSGSSVQSQMAAPTPRSAVPGSEITESIPIGQPIAETRGSPAAAAAVTSDLESLLSMLDWWISQLKHQALEIHVGALVQSRFFTMQIL